MTFDDAYELTSQVLSAYKNHHKHFPARVTLSRIAALSLDNSVLREASRFPGSNRSGAVYGLTTVHGDGCAPFFTQ